MTKQEILNKLEKEGGFFIDRFDEDFKAFSDLDGKHARKYLEDRGFVVISNGDRGTHGYALTQENVYLSTNGWCSTRVK